MNFFEKARLNMTPNAKEASEYLQGWLEKWRSGSWKQFIEMYRGQESVTGDPPFMLYNAFIYHDGLVHQDKAFKELSLVVNDDARDHFLGLWGKKELAAPKPHYQTQRDNPSYSGMWAGNTCNCSATAMQTYSLHLAGYGDAPPVNDEELVSAMYYAGYDSSTDHDALNSVLRNKFGWKFDFVYNMTYSELDAELKEGKAVVTGVLHRGENWAPFGGHMHLTYRKEGKDTYVTHDPWGNGYTGYQNHNGKSIWYRKSDWYTPRWLVSPNVKSATGWARVFSGG